MFKYVIIGIIVFIIVFVLVYFFIISPIKSKNNWEDNLKEYLKKKNIFFTLNRSNQSFYDFDLMINDKEYIIKLINIPEYAVVQINNKTTWEIKYGAGNTPGKVQPHKKYLNNIQSFMNYDTKKNKVVVLIPNAKEITKYINECEMILVKPSTDVYGTNLINCNDFSLFDQE